MSEHDRGIRGLPRIHHLIGGKGTRTWVRTRDGKRVLVFLRSTVIKIGLNRWERSRLRREAHSNAVAARHPLWRENVSRAVLVAGSGLCRWRFDSIRLEDFRDAARFMEDRLTASCGFGPQPAMSAVETRGLFGSFDADLRRSVSGALKGCEVPVSSMHGDLHFFNFVRDGGRLRVIDLENFDPEGSFLYDFIDFHVFVDKANTKASWPATLRRLSETHPTIVSAARSVDADPRAVLIWFLYLKIDTLFLRRGNRQLKGADREGYLNRLRSAVAGAALAAWAGDKAALTQLLSVVV